MPRIRTIKPEFWSHPILAKQDDATRLMAIALLNFADDEGYFHAETNLVRGFARPFDDNSTITRRCLDNLSKIGYISICENNEYGHIGFIEKFSEHQRIDRPSYSKLKCYYSTNPRRTLDERSTEEGKGKEGKGKDIYIPNFEEFLNYVLENDSSVDRLKLELKYKSWIENDWNDGNGKKIKNWKSKVLNTIPYLKNDVQVSRLYKPKLS